MISVGVLPIPPVHLLKEIPMKDLEIIAQTGKQKAGGQNVNKVASCIRCKHIPTGIRAIINGRDQGKNKAEAIKIVTAKVHEQEYLKQQSEYYNLRRDTLGDGGRGGGKIRTYNFILNIVTDHRFDVKVHNVDAIVRKGQFGLLY